MIQADCVSRHEYSKGFAHFHMKVLKMGKNIMERALERGRSFFLRKRCTSMHRHTFTFCCLGGSVLLLYERLCAFLYQGNHNLDRASKTTLSSNNHHRCVWANLIGLL